MESIINLNSKQTGEKKNYWKKKEREREREMNKIELSCVSIIYYYLTSVLAGEKIVCTRNDQRSFNLFHTRKTASLLIFNYQFKLWIMSC